MGMLLGRGKPITQRRWVAELGQSQAASWARAWSLSEGNTVPGSMVGRGQVSEGDKDLAVRT